MEDAFEADMWQYTPCRISQSYFDLGDKIEIYGIEGPIRLKGAGRLFWEMASGKHRISEIVDCIMAENNMTEKDEVYKNVRNLAINLFKKELIALNWDPLYKNK